MPRTILKSLAIAALAIGAALVPVAAAENPRVSISTSMGEIRVELFADEAPQTVANFIGLAEGTKAWTDAAGRTGSGSFYAGRTFHRVIPGFMIQGGCPVGNGTGSPVPKFDDEINPAKFGWEAKAFIGEQPNPMCDRGALMRGYIQPALEAKGLDMQRSPRAAVQSALPEIIGSLSGLTVREVNEKSGVHYDAKLPPSHMPQRGSLAMANSGPRTNGSQFFINVADTPHLAGKHTVFGRVVEGMPVVDAITQVPRGANDMPQKPVTIIAITVLR